MSDEYRRAMEALARDTKMSPASAQRIEDELLQAMASHEIAEPKIAEHKIAGHSIPWLPPSAYAQTRYGGPPKPWRRRSGGRSWLRIAAAVVLVAGVLWAWQMKRPVGLPERTLVESQSDRSTPTAAVGIEKPGQPAESSQRDKALDTRRSRPAKNTARKANVVTPSGFVALPWSAGLPAFESGEIVRMDLPTAALPTYGIDISPGASSGWVQTDVLIGQDGFARAIRLVTSTTRSRQ
jgi:hypothetical protein